MSIFAGLPRELIDKCLDYARDATFILSHDVEMYYRGVVPVTLAQSSSLLYPIRLERRRQVIREKHHTEIYEVVRGYVQGEEGWERHDELLYWYATTRLGWVMREEYRDYGYGDNT